MHISVKRNLLLLFFAMIVLSFLNTETALSQTQEYKEYTVIRGDTLWGLANKVIVDPFLWPKIWKENPEIKNPDLLYPGQKIRIPLYLIQKEAPPKPVEKPAAEPKPLIREQPLAVTITPVEKKSLVDINVLTSSGYISGTIDSKGRIIGSPTGRSLLGKGDYAYITAGGTANVGNKFYILRSSGRVYHPETREFMGYLIEVMGVAEVIGIEGDAVKVKITTSFQEAAVGDFLGNFYEMEPAFERENRKTPAVKGFIVAARQRRILNGFTDIVFIDKGSKDGIEAGDTLRTMSANKYSSEPSGVIQVISTRESTAAAVVRKSDKEVMPGDMINSVEQK